MNRYIFSGLIVVLVIVEIVLVLAIVMVFRRKIDLLNQVLVVAGLLLFLFAFVCARNASMDYVQRFTANRGQISLAESTATGICELTGAGALTTITTCRVTSGTPSTLCGGHSERTYDDRRDAAG